MRYDDIVVYEI